MYLWLNEDIDKMFKKLNNIKPVSKEYDNIMLIRNSFLGDNINEMLNPSIYHEYFVAMFYLLINPDKTQKILFGNKEYKSSPINTIVDPEDFRYIIHFLPIQKYEDIKMIGHYFIQKLNLIYIKKILKINIYIYI